MKWLNSRSSNAEPTDFVLLFNEWNEVFVKIVHVLKHEFKLSYSVENFGHLLVKISIKVINQLIITLNSVPRDDLKSTDAQLYEQTAEFERSLLKHSRNISSFIDNQFELLLSQSDLQRSSSTLEFDKTSTEASSEEKLSSLNAQLSVLLDDELTHEDLENWSLVNRCVFRKVRQLIAKNRLKECEAILVRMGLPVDQVFYFVLIKSFDAELVGHLLSHFKARQLYPQLVEQIELQNEVWSLLDFGQFSINFASLSGANEQKIKNLIITGLLRLERTAEERTGRETKRTQQSIDKLAKWVDDRSLFNFLLDCNERELIVAKLNRMNITEQMLDYCIENGQELTKQHLLYNLTKSKIHPQLVERPNLVLKRLYSNCDNKNAQSFCILCKTGLFANNFKSSQFADRLIHYAIQIKQFDFVYWFLRQENNIRTLRNSRIIDPLVKGVICSLFDYQSDSQSSVKLLNVILQYCKYFNPTLTINNINDLFASGLTKEAISCMFLAPTGFNDSSLSPLQIWFMKPDVVLACLKQSYPILYEAFNYSLLDFQQQHISPERAGQESDSSLALYQPPKSPPESVPNLYALLKGAIIFDINKLFYWQSTNAHVQSAGPRTIPTFSNPQLAEKFGLKANLNYIYYLTRGRPIEAYYQEIVNKNQTDPKQIQAIYRKVSLLAFYNCLDSSIVCSCVAFLELLQLNSGSLTFQIAFARLIMKYAADFLTLKRADQQEKMGDLLNKACFEENRLAQTNILELIYMALGRKYEKNEKPLMEECIDYEIAVLFARKYSLDLPTQFLLKCIRNDDWLFLTVYVQIYEYPREVFEHLLKDKDGSLFNNGCVAEHLSKAFASIAYLSDSNIEMAAGSNKDAKQNVSRTKNNLYLRIVQRKMHANRFARQSSSPQFTSGNRYSPSEIANSPTDSADLDLTNADTVTIASSLSEYEGLTFDAFNSPKVIRFRCVV